MKTTIPTQPRQLTYVDFGLPANPFPEVAGPIKFGGGGNSNPLAFSSYDANEIIMGKTMADHLPFAVPMWHMMHSRMSDMFGDGTALPVLPGAWGEEFAQYELRVRVFFYMLYITRVTRFTFHDFDIVPKGESLEEFHANLDKMVPILLELMELTGVKCAWVTQNLFTFPRYNQGCGTAADVDAFALGWAQIKKMIEVGHKLKALAHVFWGGREGVNDELVTRLEFEQDHMAKLLHMAVVYKEKIGYTAQFEGEPKPKEPAQVQNDETAAVTIAFLRKYKLDKYFKLNLEVNHAQLAKHTMFYECMVAFEAGMYCGIDANQGKDCLDWDTDLFPRDPYIAFGIMYWALKNGGFGPGSVNFDAKRDRGSFAVLDLIYALILGMDTMAKGLRIAVQVIQDGQLEAVINQRYGSWDSEIGRMIDSDNPDLEAIARYGYGVSFGVEAHNSSRHEMVAGIITRAVTNAERKTPTLN